VGGSAYIAYTDMCYAPKLNYLMATYFNYLALVDPQTGEYLGVWDWGPYVKAELVGVTHLGSEYNSNYNAWVDVFLILDADGNVYRFGIMLLIFSDEKRSISRICIPYSLIIQNLLFTEFSSISFLLIFHTKPIPRKYCCKRQCPYDKCHPHTGSRRIWMEQR
jgi:hypothetical protein